MGQSKFSVKEKAEMIIRDLENLNNLNLELNEIQFSCPSCRSEYTDSIQSTWARIFHQSTGRIRQFFLEDEKVLACKNKTCTNKLSQKRESVISSKKKTCLEKYGVSSYLETNDSKQKCKSTILDKYGSYEAKFAKSWKTYEEKTGYTHNMRNPESVKLNQEHRISTILSMSKEQKENWVFKRKETHKKNGTRIFGEIQSRKFIFKHYSDQEIELFDTLKLKTNLEMLYGENQKILFKENGYFMIDCYIPSKNMVIEYNGDYWHANPVRYNKNSVMNFPKGQFLAEEIWKKDKNRIEHIKKELNCSIVIVWEDEYINNKEQTIQILLKEINSD